MASTKEYLEFVLDQLSELDNVSYKKMMGEYIIYYQNEIVGGIYDNRFLVKFTKSARTLMPDAPIELPYKGGKGMLLVEDIDDVQFLNRLLKVMIDELSAASK